ncbi:hypothetical protein N658DRAFT_136317 [Parathielavia hyrcaniae]|uniref:Uncharacterized protein n=1 Tax=Parathielavia hyrcaniae TaxID=113614 RepID=A0AAN6T6B4_9PEZI|nr:hypothetical protein N658DRAFT_136317 [Parathielavia hyrcaniae]
MPNKTEQFKSCSDTQLNSTLPCPCASLQQSSISTYQTLRCYCPPPRATPSSIKTNLNNLTPYKVQTPEPNKCQPWHGQAPKWEIASPGARYNAAVLPIFPEREHIRLRADWRVLVLAGGTATQEIGRPMWYHRRKSVVQLPLSSCPVSVVRCLLTLLGLSSLPGNHQPTTAKS